MNENENGTQNNGGQQVPEAQGTQVSQQPANAQTNPPTQTVTEPPKPNWFKRHWKGVTAGAVGVVTAVGSAFVAYKKGKAAGIMSVPQPPAEDYSLDPNK